MPPRRRAIVSNKPNLACRPEPQRAKYAEQTQSPPRRVAGANRPRKTKPIRLAEIPQHSNRVPIPRNKASCPKRGTEAVSGDRAEAMDVEQTTARSPATKQSGLPKRDESRLGTLSIRRGGRLLRGGRNDMGGRAVE
jgi:hypothetical protein